MASMPSLHRVMLWGFIRASLPPLIFRRGGSFNTSFVPWNLGIMPCCRPR